MIVQFYKTKNDGTQEEIGTAELENERVVFSDMNSFMKDELRDFGILYNGRKYFPEEGLEFLKVLPKVFSGSMFRAERIE